MHTLEEIQNWATDHITDCNAPNTAINFVENLGANCLEYGAQCMQEAEDSGKLFESKIDAAVYMINSGHTAWKEAIQFCKDKHNISIYRYGFLMICKNIDTKETISNQIIHDATEICIQQAEKDDIADKKHYLDYNEVTELLEEYFALIQELGTFYQDPSRYAKNSDREKHERVMKIYKQLIQTN